MTGVQTCALPIRSEEHTSELQSRGLISYAVFCLTDPNAWFIKTDVPNGLKHFVRTPMSTGMDGDFDTGNVRYKARERYSFGWSDPLGMWGSSGSN